MYISHAIRFSLIVGMLFISSCAGKLNERYLSSSKPVKYFTSDEKPYHPETIFCYQSLADVECFKTEQKGRGEQLINYIDKETDPNAIPTEPVGLYSK